MAAKTKGKAKPSTKKTSRRKVTYEGQPVKKDVALTKGYKRAIGAKEFFKFDAFGQKVEGQFVKIEQSKKKNYSDALVLRKDDGSLVNVPFQYNIEQQFDLNSIVAGFYVVITFVEVLQVSKSRKMKRFVIDFKPGKL